MTRVTDQRLASRSDDEIIIVANEVLRVPTGLIIGGEPVTPHFVDIESQCPFLQVLEKSSEGWFEIWNPTLVMVSFSWTAHHLHSEESEPIPDVENEAAPSPDPAPASICTLPASAVEIPPLTFLNLLDTPNSYSGFSGFGLRVNAGEDALEFFDLASVIEGIKYSWPDAAGRVAQTGMVDGELGVQRDTGDVYKYDDPPGAWSVFFNLQDGFFATATRGDILRRGAAGWEAYSPGPAGYLLRSQGALSDPVWSEPILQVIGAAPPQTISTVTSLLDASWAIGRYANVTPGINAISMGYGNYAYGKGSHAEGVFTLVNGEAGHSEGQYGTCNGRAAHLEGYSGFANYFGAHVEGIGSQAQNFGSHCEGYYGTSTGSKAHAEGSYSQSQGEASHAEGYQTRAIGDFSHSEGSFSQAQGEASHSEGLSSIAEEDYSHAEGAYSLAYLFAQHSHASGRFSSAGDAQHSKVVVRNTTTDTTTTELVSGVGNRIFVDDDRSINFTVDVVGRQVGGGAGTVGDSKTWKIQGGIKRVGAVCSLIGANNVLGTTQDVGAAAWVVSVTADNGAQKALKIDVTGEVNKTIRWVGSVHMAEVV